MPGSRREFAERIRPQVGEQVAIFWPALDFRQEYRRLLGDVDALAAASSRRLGDQESAILSASLSRRPYVFASEDLGSLCYLDQLLNERPNSRFEHVVLDEAQEVSPIELLLIKRHTQGNNFTILGDLTQSLSPQGIDRWREVLQLFRGATRSQYLVRTSNRATYEITKYANRLLKQAMPGGVPAAPFPRHGPRPGFRPAAGYQEMTAGIAADIRELESHGNKSIGILCKSAVDAKKMHRTLHGLGVKVGLLDREKVTSESVVVAPIYLTRGLEYDAVILAGASKEHYHATDLHTRLLYLALTRAAHELRIHWFGQPAPQLGVRRLAPKKNLTRKRRSTLRGKVR